MKFENLGTKDDLTTFIGDQSVNSIVTVQLEEATSIAHTDSQLLVHIDLHAITSKPGKKLMGLKNSPNDEILTRKFGLLLKHGDQTKVIYDINEKEEV